jgi:fructose-bisphosphate aldolase class I
MRSLILSPNEEGIKDVIHQQFDIAKIILEHGLVPILEMEVDIHSMEKAKSEEILKRELLEELNKLDPNAKVILEFSLPNVPDFYKEVVEHPNVVRVLAASSGYKKTEADKKLSQNHGMIASFSRALEEGLMYQETDFEFDMILKESIQAIFDASIK